MKKRIILTTVFIAIAIVGLLFIQYFWNVRMFRAEKKLIQSKASWILQESLDFHLHDAVMDRYDMLESAGFLRSGDGYGGNFDDKTITVCKVFPDKVTFTRQCKTKEEWYEYSKHVHCRYHLTGINLNRLDSTFKSRLESNGITLPYYLALSDSTDTIFDHIPIEADLSRFQLPLDTLPLGIDGKDFLIVRFDGSYFGLYKQMRSMSLVSLGIGFLLFFAVIFTGTTVFYQRKVFEMNKKNLITIAHNLMNQVYYIDKALSVIKVNKSQQNYVLTMKQKNEWMSLLIEKLQFTTLNKKTIVVYPENICLNDFIGEIAEQFNAEHESLNFHFDCDNTRPVTARVDPAHLGYAMINLIENAVKYSGKNTDIFIGCHEKDNRACITVRDRGIGIPVAHQRKIFKPNYRVPETESISQKGFGLGLYYVKMVAKSHGGDVTVASENKKGSTFTLTLPMT